MPRVRKKLVRPRFRIYSGNEIAIGPGKAELLEAITSSGSIQQAAQSLEMSYMRAWKLVRTMNAYFTEPLVGAHRGGRHKGGAWLTPLGIRVLTLYQSLEEESIAKTRPIWQKLIKQMK